MHTDNGVTSAWFSGPKAENGPWFNAWLARIAEDYCAWRRNYFPEDGVVVDSALRRENEPFMDAFEDRLLELLARLKGDVPFHSPRYAGHMLAEQTLPSVAGFFAAMLYNPNNVTTEVAPVTVRLEIEAGRLLSRMIGYDEDAWSHLCSGGTLANIEALWVARSVRYLPFLVRDARRAIGVVPAPHDESDATLLAIPPMAALLAYDALWRQIAAMSDPSRAAAAAREAIANSPMNVGERGLSAVESTLGGASAVLVPETHHYCFEKAMDLLGLGRRALVSVRVDERFRMRVDALEGALDALVREGRHPLAVVAVLGATEEGSIDPLDRIAALRDQRERRGMGSFWLHADAAYGGYLRTVAIPERVGLGEPNAAVRIGGVVRKIPIALPGHEECDALDQMRCCDSVAIDPHKLGYIPYPAGAVCFRSRLIKPLVRQVAPYLGDPPVEPEGTLGTDAIGLYVIEGSKPGASAAAVWLSHTLIPLDTTGHGRLMRENIRNACELHALLEQYPELAAGNGTAIGVRAVCLCPPGSNIVCYAFRPDPRDTSASLARINALNRAILDRFSPSSGQRVYDRPFFVSRTVLNRSQYSLETVGPFLERLETSALEYETDGVFLLRSVLMNPWCAHAKRRGRYFLSELVTTLYDAASEIWRAMRSEGV